MYVLDLFVKVPSGAAAPIKYKPTEVDAINQVSDGKRATEASHVRLQQPNFWTAGGVSVEDRSKGTEAVRPQFGECCEKQSECDSALGAKSDENDVELNGETGEDMEDGETGFDDGSVQVSNIFDPRQPTVNEHQEHMTTHRLYRSWCKFCVMGRGVNSPYKRSDAQDDLEGVAHVSTDHGFFGERESEEQRAVGLVAGQARTRVPPDARIWCWLVEFAAYLMHRCDISSEGKTPLQRLHGRKDNKQILDFGEKILYVPAKPARGGKCETRFHPGVFVGMLNLSSKAVVVTEQGLAIKTRANVRRIPESKRWDADRIL